MNEASLIQAIASVPPASIALRDGGRTLTYGQLNQSATTIAHHLFALNVTPGTTVAICLPRSFAQIASALGAFHAGAAYVPLDPDWPQDRIQHVLADSACAALLAPASLAAQLHTVIPTFDPTFLPPAQTAPPLAVPSPTDLAYLIYTSGSTGLPKGVEITHANLAHLIAWHNHAFAVTPNDRATHLAGLAFDAAVWEIWPHLAVGASISLADSITRNDPALLQQWLVDENITISFVPTPLAEPIIAMPWPATTRLRLLLTGGDTLHTAPTPGLPFQLINNYGPTEGTVVATSGLVPPGITGLPTIGKPIAGAAIYLLDESRQPVAEGEIGEIYLGGNGVGRGYRNLPLQTVQSFLPDPFSTAPGARMYRTGDLARQLPGGQLAFLGRQDTQQKIRGYRIELNEIIHVLQRHPAVSFCTVTVRTTPAAGKTLAAYIVPNGSVPASTRDLQEFAARALPDYMVPATFVRLAAIPLTFNGKVDTRALPDPCPENAFDAPATREPASEIEQILLDIVRDLLHTGSVSVEDDFFLAGGHSLLGTQLVLRARETFGVMLTLRDLFEAPSVALLALRIEEHLIEQLEAMSDDEALALAEQGHTGGPRA